MYQNPVLNVPGKDQGDPAILRYKGVYYLYHTGQFEIPIYTSRDLVNWQYQQVALEASPEHGHWAGIDLWAPEVIYANGKFYMYVTGASKRAGKGDDNLRRIGVACADSPTGPFRLADTPLTDHWSIDAHPFLDSDGSWYLFYNVRNQYTKGPGGVIGCGNVVDKMVSFTRLQGSPSLVCKPDFPWEGSLEGDWFWNEGPFTIKRLGKYYQMYSGGCYYQPTYHLAYATATVCHDTDGMESTSWQKWPKGRSRPILQSNQEVWGPGHHVVTLAPNGVDPYVIYHGHVGDDKTRTTYIDPLYWHGESIFIDGPSAHGKPQPAKPLVLKESWSVQAKQYLTPCLENYVWEMWVQLDNPFALILAEDIKQQIRLEFASSNSCMVITQGNSCCRKEIQLPASSDWHFLHIVRNGYAFSLYCDQLLVWEGHHLIDKSQVSVETEQKRDFAGVCITNFFADCFSSNKAGNTSSDLIRHTLKDNLSPWKINDGEVQILDYGIQGKRRHNTISRSFESDSFQLEVDLSLNGRAVIKLCCGVLVLDNADNKITINDKVFFFTSLPHRNEHHLIVNCSKEVLIVTANGKQVIAADAPQRLESSPQVQLELDDTIIINNIKVVGR